MRAFALGSALGLLALLVGCSRKDAGGDRDSLPRAGSEAIEKDRNVKREVDPELARPGMIMIPKGQLITGTPADVSPRIAEEEPAGVPAELDAYYIDKFPYPNEQGALATTNVTRDEAERLCAAKKKRLCTEAEWERACKGPEQATYEYGMMYNAKACGTGGAAARQGAHPAGEHPACKSSFGVVDMHGGAWEWTSSTWARTEPEPNLGVLRGGNATAGELVGRCSNALARPLATHQQSIGFRCCAGGKNDVSFAVPKQSTMKFQRIADVDKLSESFHGLTTNLWGSTATEVSDYDFQRAWHWRPVANEELVLAVGCEKRGGPWARCGVTVTRLHAGKTTLLAQFGTGNRIPDVPEPKDEARKIHIRAVDVRGTFGRELTYVFGRVNATEESRP
jgi:formylglycine-generating enzyme